MPHDSSVFLMKTGRKTSPSNPACHDPKLPPLTMSIKVYVYMSDLWFSTLQTFYGNSTGSPGWCNSWISRMRSFVLRGTHSQLPKRKLNSKSLFPGRFLIINLCVQSLFRFPIIFSLVHLTNDGTIWFNNHIWFIYLIYIIIIIDL